jgi:hypothetical protein
MYLASMSLCHSLAEELVELLATHLEVFKGEVVKPQYSLDFGYRIPLTN